MSKARLLLVSYLIGLLVFSWSPMAKAAESYPFDYSFQLTKVKRVGITVFEFTFAVIVENGDRDLKNLSFSLNSTSPHTIVTDGHAFLGDVSAGERIVGLDPIKFRHDMRFMFDLTKITWGFEYEMGDPREYGLAGSHEVLKYTERNFGNSVIYYPSDIGLCNKTPVIFFAPGWDSTDPEDYHSLLTFIASHGYAVIFAKDAREYSAQQLIEYFEQMLDISNNVLPYLDTTRIGVIGHSSGGGHTFRILEHFSQKGFGENGRFLLALDPWFAFDMTREKMANLPNNTNLVILQFGKDGGETDPRIPLSEYALLASIDADQKDYQVYDEDNIDHDYPTGSRPYEEMQGVLRPLDALMEYTFKNPESDYAHEVALEQGSDDPYGNGTGIQIVRPLSDYQYRCDGRDNSGAYATISQFNIDYCMGFMRDADTGLIKLGPQEIEHTPLEKGTLFAAPNGQGDECTETSPCSIRTAFSRLQAGDVLFLRGGVYQIRQQLTPVGITGTSDQPIIIESYPGEKAILEGEYIDRPVERTGHAYYYGIKIPSGSNYFRIRKIEVRYMGNAGISLHGSFNIVEGCESHHNVLSGIEIYGGDWHDNHADYQEGYNIIRDNFIHDNSDEGLSSNGNSADGIAISSGKFNKVFRNLVYSNSDDGIDTWRSNDTYVAYNIVYDNGKADGDGNGIKAGGNLDPTATNGMRARVERNISYLNRARGFDYNAGKDVYFEYNTAYDNGTVGFRGADDTVMQFNISAENGTDVITTGPQTLNSWQIEGSVNFLSIDPSSIDFLRVSPDSPFYSIGAYGCACNE